MSADPGRTVRRRVSHVVATVPGAPVLPAPRRAHRVIYAL